MRIVVACVLAVGFSQTLCGQQWFEYPPASDACTIGFVPKLEKAPSPQFQAKIDALRHRSIYACARSLRLEWAEKIVIPEAKIASDCSEAHLKFPRPEFPPLQPLRIEDAGYVVDPTPKVTLLFRLPSGRQVKISFSTDDRAWDSEDPLAILASFSGFYLDPYNTPFTPAEVESIQQKDFSVGTRREVLGCAYGWDAKNMRWDQLKRQWWVFDGRAYRFDNDDARVAEIRNVAEMKSR
jgi:hypothetical protein